METKQYIVKLHDYVDVDRHFDQLTPSLGHHSTITRSWTSDFVNAYAGILHSRLADYLRQHHEVDYIEEDLPVFTLEVKSQSDAPWHLQRINQDARLSGTRKADYRGWRYTYDSSAGGGVDIYILDTGIHIEHEEFGGRARWGPTFGSGIKGSDKNGHGTHVAGIAAGKRWGVAKAANIIAVKVAGDDSKGEGKCSDLIAGLEWVFLQAKASGRPSVVNISVGYDCGPISQAVNNAILSTTNAGIHVVVSAGNSDTEASSSCPANAPSALTVGASNIDDERWVSKSGFGSNYGPAVDIFAPGDHIISCKTGTDSERIEKTGTSMASAIVAGIIARLISMNGNAPPSVMAKNLKRQGVKGVLDLKCDGTENVLARCCIMANAEFSFKSTFAKFEVGLYYSWFSIPSFRKPDHVPASVYEGMSWDPKSPNLLRWGEEDTEKQVDRPTVEKTIPILIVNDGSTVTFKLYHDTDKDKGYYAHAKVASTDMYSAGDSSSEFKNHPVRTETALARFSFNSNWASVTVTEPTYLRKASEPNSLTSRTLKWDSNGVDSTDNLPYIIISPKLVTDVTLSYQGNQSDTAETTFADCTYASTDNKIWTKCPVKSQTVFASFSYSSNWAKFGVTTAGTSVRKDPGAPSNAYDDVVFTNSSVQWKTVDNKTYTNSSIPILIVGPESKININLDHGTDGTKSGDKAGRCSVYFGNRVYSYSSDSKDKTFSGCPLETVVADALFSFESNSAKVKLPTGGWVQKDPNADATIYNDSNLEITATSLSWASIDYVAKTLPLQILTPSPGLAIDVSISRGLDGKEKGDGKGSASVTFGNHKYINNSEFAGNRDELLFNGCRLDGGRVLFDPYASI